MADFYSATARAPDRFRGPVSLRDSHREALIRMIAAHSPMAWAHINMLGEYDFSDE